MLFCDARLQIAYNDYGFARYDSQIVYGYCGFAMHDSKTLIITILVVARYDLFFYLILLWFCAAQLQNADNYCGFARYDLQIAYDYFGFAMHDSKRL